VGTNRRSAAVFVSCLVGASQLSCASGPYHCNYGNFIANYRRYASLTPPDCTSTRHKIHKDLISERNACWRWGSVNDRALSASCRIDPAGKLECWRKELRDAPKGEFVSLDENGHSRRAPSASNGSVACWANEKHWSPYGLERFKTVSVGMGWSPYDSSKDTYACGVTETQQIVCWEGARDGHVFRIAGNFTSVEAGLSGVCGITLDGELQCWQNGGKKFELARREILVSETGPLPSFESINIGYDSLCVRKRSGETNCWGHRITTSGSTATFGPDINFVRAGDSHVCGVRSSGELLCVGDSRPAPKNIKFKTISEPAFLTDTYCGISVDGIGYCWGDPNDDPTAISDRWARSFQQ
jgi:hypothetical protein